MKVDIDLILSEIMTLIRHKDEQIMLQTIKDNITNITKDSTFGIGGFAQYRDMGLSETDFNDPLFNIPYTNSIINQLKMYRTRIMIMKPRTCYSYHVDGTPRIHIPLITNKNNFMVIEDKSYWMPTGNAYYTNTLRKHTFINGDINLTRIHIVGCVDKDPKNDEVFYSI